MGHTLSKAVTASVIATQKRQCPQGTSVTAARGCSRQTDRLHECRWLHCHRVMMSAVLCHRRCHSL